MHWLREVALRRPRTDELAGVQRHSSTAVSLHKPSDSSAIGFDLLLSVRCVRDLGIFIDAEQTMHTQVTQTCSKCFTALRQLRSIRQSVSNDILQLLVVVLMFCKFDFGSATLAGLLKQLTDRLQPVQNAATLLIFKACHQDHDQPLLRRLHWL